MSAPISFSEALRLDVELTRLARGASAVRLALGSALQALSASGGYYELGFSSFEAYARERCQRSGRWAADTRELSERDLALGIVAERATRAEVWRRLGFATEAQYARERLGVSVSSLKAKRILASRASRVPELASALSAGRIGYEAAYLLSRVVTPGTAKDWIERAERRTVKHLREEVDVAEFLIRMGQPRGQRPLDEASLDEFFELERSIVSGDWFGQDRDSWAE